MTNIRQLYRSQAGYEIIQQQYEDNLKKWMIPYKTTYVLLASESLM